MGRGAKLERFISEYSERGFRFAYELCRNAEEAQELVQEAFFRVIRRWDQYDAALSLENWFLTILRNVYYDALRRYERRHCLSLDAPCPGRDDGVSDFADVLADGAEEDILERLARRETAEEVKAVLDALSPEHRAILILCDMEGLRYEQISVVLDCPLGTVRSRVSRARDAFRKKMSERTGEVVEP